jgi:hypothetical protein
MSEEQIKNVYHGFGGYGILDTTETVERERDCHRLEFFICNMEQHENFFTNLLNAIRGRLDSADSEDLDVVSTAQLLNDHLPKELVAVVVGVEKWSYNIEIWENKKRVGGLYFIYYGNKKPSPITLNLELKTPYAAKYFPELAPYIAWKVNILQTKWKVPITKSATKEID